jgi:Uma2 family endonuclease
MAQPTLPLYNYAEYLERLEASEIRLEYVDGLVYAMAGGTPEHNRVDMRLTLQVGSQLKSPCEAYGPDQCPGAAQQCAYFTDAGILP